MRYRRTVTWVIRSIAMPATLLAAFASAQPKPHEAPDAKGGAKDDRALTQEAARETQEQLIRLLRLSPTLTTVVAHDPSLLSNPDYVSRNNPQLAQFLQSHPEVARNPDFYLFSKLSRDGGERLERAVWPEYLQPRPEPSTYQLFMHDLGPFLVFLCIVGCLLWLVRLLLENRRWGRVFKSQLEVHGKLIERFGSNQELLTYMGTDAGRRFLEAAPIAVDFERDQRVPSAVARVLNPLQIGIVLTLLGIGFLFLRHALVELEAPMLVLGTLVLMPGIGFILSAAVTWMLAGRLGLMPENTSRRITTPFDSNERQ
ncbi:hypothetical protein [Edaphobacter bradus]|uniref:hypothetical protein n=1 Tax=Edaphobacter bradus TaxID=2259016 RepID=UPI0021E0F00C|nr:hypothetical protein [Edaphobacter bradus]